MPDTIQIFDVHNQYPWQLVEITFDFGQMVHRTRYNDDETRVEESFQNGVLTEMVQTDDSADGLAVNWEYVLTQFDYTGQLQSRETRFDDGRVFTQTYQDGVLQSCFRVDEGTGENPEGNYNWEISITEYDSQTGRAFRHFIQYDDGSEQETMYHYSGGIESIYLRDSYEYNPDGTIGSANWDSQYTMFDEAGEIVQREIQYDDGGWKSEQYQNGMLYSSQAYDGYENSHIWESLDIAYDETGQLIHQHYRFDDGSERTENYHDGVITDSYAYNWNNDPEYGQLWNSVTMHYDEQGLLLHRDVQNHDGTSKVDQYEAGTIVRSDSYDHHHGPDGQAWEQQSFLFNLDGDLEVRGIFWDTGDTEATFYAPDGSYEHRYYDGDDSNDWQARTTYYDDTGAVVWSEEYADEDPLPPDYIPYDLFNGGGYYAV